VNGVGLVDDLKSYADMMLVVTFPMQTLIDGPPYTFLGPMYKKFYENILSSS